MHIYLILDLLPLTMLFEMVGLLRETVALDLQGQGFNTLGRWITEMYRQKGFFHKLRWEKFAVSPLEPYKNSKFVTDTANTSFWINYLIYYTLVK